MHVRGGRLVVHSDPERPSRSRLPIVAPYIVLILVLAGARPASADSNRADRETIRQTLHGLVSEEVEGDPSVVLKTLLPSIEQRVLQDLNRGESVSELDEWMSSLPGFTVPDQGHNPAIGVQLPYVEIAGNCANYYLGPLSAARPDVLVLQLAPLPFNSPGQISLLRSGTLGWTSLSTYAGNNIGAEFIDGPSETPVIVIRRFYLGADHSRGSVEISRLKADRMVDLSGGLPSDLLDGGAEIHDGKVILSARDLPDAIAGAMSGPRREREYTVSIAGDRASVALRELNPWVAVVDEFYVHVDRKELGSAAALLADPALLPALVSPGAGDHMSEDESGDLESGKGEVVMDYPIPDDSYPYARILSSRDAQGQWKITGIVRGNWTDNHVEWEDGRVDTNPQGE